jgi:hypothetical protein
MTKEVVVAYSEVYFRIICLKGQLKKNTAHEQTFRMFEGRNSTSDFKLLLRSARKRSKR